MFGCAKISAKIVLGTPGHFEVIPNPIRKCLYLLKFVANAGSSSAPSLLFDYSTGSLSFKIKKYLFALDEPRLPPTWSESR
jgi:hypothetical protein